MIEFPSIINSSKAPRKLCTALDKFDREISLLLLILNIMYSTYNIIK